MIAGLTRRNVLALMGALAPAAAIPAPYPEKPVRLIVALAPGGPADTAARVFAPPFAEALGQNVLVDNRPGGSAVVGTEAAVRAAPDGYTLLFGSSSTFSINPAVLKSLRFDAQKELRLIGLICYTPHVLVVRASLPVQTFPDLVRLSKAQPDTLRYGSSGIGGAIHLAGELVKRETGADLRHIPYRGGGPAILGLLAGDIEVFISDLSTTAEHIRSRPDQGAGDGVADALAAASRRADVRRAGIPHGGLRVMVRSGRTGCDATRGDRAADPGDETGTRLAAPSSGHGEDRQRAVHARR